MAVEASMHARSPLAPLGSIVAVGGSLVSIGTFWVDHMNAALWSMMIAGIVTSGVAGGLLVHLARRTRPRG